MRTLVSGQGSSEPAGTAGLWQAEMGAGKVPGSWLVKAQGQHSTTEGTSISNHSQ